MRNTLAILSTLSLATAGFAADPPDLLGWKVSGFFQYRYEWTQNPRGVAEDIFTNDPLESHVFKPIPPDVRDILGPILERLEINCKIEIKLDGILKRR